MTNDASQSEPQVSQLPFSHPNYQRNRDRVRAGFTPCALCGLPVRPMRPGIYRYMVVVVDGGASFGDLSSDESDRGYMGGFPVGPACARILRGAGVWVGQ